MHYSKETKKLVSCALIVASIVTITPMTAKAGENRLEVEHAQEETEVQLSPVITVGEATKTASISDAIWKTSKEEVLATPSNAFDTKSTVVEKSKQVEIATESNANEVEEKIAEEVKVATASDATLATEEVATASDATLATEKVATASDATLATEEVTTASDTMQNKEETAARKLIPLGIFKTTGYCSCRKCSGSWGGRTASGAIVQERHTVAVDPRRIPYGTKLLINGITYTAEDCGSGVKGKHIDIYYGNHRTAQAHGLQRAEVFMVV